MTIIPGFQVPFQENHPLDDYVKELKQAGFQWMEVIAPEFEDRGLEEKIIMVSKKFSMTVSVHAQFMDVNLTALHPDICNASIEAIHKNLQFAKKIGARLVVLHGGFVHWSDFLPQSHPLFEMVHTEFLKLKNAHIDKLIQALNQLLQITKEYQIKLAIENLGCEWEIPTSIEDINRINRHYNQNELGIVLDFAHAAIAGLSPNHFIDRFNHHITHVHINQNDNNYDLHLPIHSLSADWSLALRRLHALEKPLGLILEMSEQPLSEIIKSKDVLMEALVPKEVIGK